METSTSLYPAFKYAFLPLKHPYNYLTCLGTAFPVVRFGTYELYCGNQNLEMTAVLRYAQMVLRLAIADLESGHPGHGYRQLFKTIPPSEIRDIFRQILAGSARTFRLAAKLSPRILCVNPQTVRSYRIPRRLYQGCQQPEDHQYVAGYVYPTPYIILCEPFWTFRILPTLPQEPPRSNLCPHWDPATRQISRSGPAAHDFLDFQTFAFIHECIHFYIENLSDRSSIPPETYLLHEITGLDESHIRMNPVNYETYLASESIFTVLMEIFRGLFVS